MFKKILIANRGEIACRVAATCARLGIKTVAIYSPVDAHAKHVLACDEAIAVGDTGDGSNQMAGNAPKDSYLRWQTIIAAAKQTGAQAIHPGYGFLSENEAFADSCVKAGLVFIGPPANAIQAMGLKAESKQLMEKAGVPLVPGYHGANQDATFLQTQADAIGYPVLIKASAGGGGKGMRIVDKSADFADALASCKREAINSFGDDNVLIEKYVQRPRHIEIQVFGDTHGNYVHLFERDCSVQRRHQKVLEEAPAPGLSQAMREQMGATAIAAARAVNYVGAGTVEFIVETAQFPAEPPQGKLAPSGGSATHKVASVGAFYFMEMNTRLQVEHPVTEAITGLDLVEWQLRVANGEKLPLQQHELHINGHAIEARICAENPDKQFMPAIGDIKVYELPQHVAFKNASVSNAEVSVRVDSGVRAGDAISPYYDPMIAKLIVHGATREQALARMDKALSQTHIVGLQSNVQFLRHVVNSASFATANLDTGLIPREEQVLFNQKPIDIILTVAAAVANTLQAEVACAVSSNGHKTSTWVDPWGKVDAWQSHGERVRNFEFEIDGETVSAQLRYAHAGQLHLSVGDTSGALQYVQTSAGIDVHYAGQRIQAKIYQFMDMVSIFTAYGAMQIVVNDKLSHAGEVHEEGGRLTAPMPGKVVSFAIQKGDKVSKGQALAVMDAMKMEHTICSPADGVVQELLYLPGDQVAEGAELLKLSAS
ncbi:MAG TPA: acetyl/propionyl/methylcrotonyl-CoA carboxylase subunit alpha [Burkholderiaceae bacterium]|nr:acetyl/propionyl/methylcrotonyl-CoA carboxylase subunit alpha [Burkholderiaceae bacterium]